MTATKAINIHAPTNVNRMFRVADAVYEGRSHAKDLSSFARSADAPDKLRARSSQETVDIYVVSAGEFVLKMPLNIMPDVIAQAARSEPSDLKEMAGSFTLAWLAALVWKMKICSHFGHIIENCKPKTKT